MKASKEFPVMVVWGGKWVRTVGRKLPRRNRIEARVFDVAAREWVWDVFAAGWWTEKIDNSMPLVESK